LALLPKTDICDAPNLSDALRRFTLVDGRDPVIGDPPGGMSGLMSSKVPGLVIVTFFFVAVCAIGSD
jgi:hypothetical protein